MPPPPPKRPKSAAAKGSALPGTGGLPPENPQQKAIEAQKKAQEVARKNQVTVPPRDIFDNYKLGDTGLEVYDLICQLDLENASSSGIYTLLGRKVPSLEYAADFQAESRDAIQGALRALTDKRRLPRPEILRHLFAALVFFAPKAVLPVPVATQVVAQEVMYAKWNPHFMDEFPMRTLAYALGLAVAVLQLSGSIGSNQHYTHSADNMEAVLRGLGEGIKSATLLVAGAPSQAMANLQKFQQGIEEGYEAVKKEYFTRSAAGLLGKFLGKKT